MRLWHLLLGIVVAAFVFGFIRLVGWAAVATGAGLVLVVGSLILLSYADDIWYSCRRQVRQARSRRGLKCVVPLMCACLMGLSFLVAAGLSIAVLLLAVAFGYQVFTRW